MSLDSRFFIAPSLQMYFVDKEDGTPLAAGVVTFYKDSSRSVLKKIYKLSGSPPYSSASYVELENPVTLSAVGTFQDDDGNDIIPYYFPYDGTPDDSQGNIELYYITVYSAGGTPQFTREAWPNTTALSTEEQNGLMNYVPNGQFLLHNDEPVLVSAGGRDIYQIAQGGWTFEKPTASIGTDTISFPRANGPSTNPNVDANPRYSFNLTCSVAGADAYKDLCLKFPDVNKFASSDNVYTLSFQGLANDGDPVNVDLRLIKNYGTGGSSPTDISLDVVTINEFEDIYNIAFTFGDNAGKIIGEGDDDYVELAIRFPNSTYDISLTDFLLTFGQVDIVSFPQTTNAEFISQSTVGWLPTPNPDGSNLYLPIVLTPTGATYDDSEVGVVESVMSISVAGNRLVCDGTKYRTSDYSALGIPYSRLFNKIFQTGASQCPLYGTGSTFSTATFNAGATSQLVLATNQAGSQTNPADGTISTGFTFSALVPGQADIGFTAYSNAGGYVMALSTFTANTITSLGFSPHTSGIAVYFDINQPSVTGKRYGFQFLSLSAASLGNGGGAGKYFTFESNTTAYYVWFQTATETDPAPGGTGIKVILDIAMTAADTAYIISRAIAGFQVNKIVMVAASTPILAGAYFTFQANAVTYSPWYKVDGEGSAPITANPIEIDLDGTETAAEVVTATQIAINSVFFAVPDLRGMFLRGIDSSATWDFDATYRSNLIPNTTYAMPGSFEFDSFAAHNHALSRTSGDNIVVGAGILVRTDLTNQPTTISTVGHNENRPLNKYVYYAIKY